MHAAVTSYIDVAQIVLYMFWAFLAALVYYLRMEDKREGYPLEAGPGLPTSEGYPPMPSPKTFRLADGTRVQTPNPDAGDKRAIKATPVGNWHGAPLQPDGDPMLDAVGPASYAERKDIADVTVGGAPKIVPLRIADGFYLDSADPDPRGMKVIGCDNEVGGVVKDVWVDRSEHMIRYFEVAVANGRNVLLPTTMARVSGSQRKVLVKSITSAQFANVPGTKSTEQVTRLEEDRICGYYAGGHLYATPDRAEPLI